MFPIHKIYGKKLKPGAQGLELEVEFESGTPIYSPSSNQKGVWITHIDHSLNHGIEYVTRHPIKVDGKYDTHIRSLLDVINGPGYKIKPSSRTSLHIHQNVGGFSPVRVWTLATIWWLIEDILIRAFCDNTRWDNHFCLRVKRTPGLIDMAIKDVDRQKPFQSFNKELCKYGSIGLHCVGLYGSFEFRPMHGTTDPDKIIEWGRLINYLAEKSGEFSAPDAVMDMYLDLSKKDFLDVLLPPHIVSKVKSACPDFATMCADNSILIAPFAYCQPDWKEWQDAMDEYWSSQKMPTVSELPDPLTIQYGDIEEYD